MLTKDVIEKSRKQQLMIMVLLVIVSAVIIALIIYTMTMDKVRSIATLKFVGAPDRTIVGLIVQQALSMGIFGYFTGLALVLDVPAIFSAAPRARSRERRRCVRHHDRGVPCGQHPWDAPGAQGGPGGSTFRVGVAMAETQQTSGRSGRTPLEAFRRRGSARVDALRDINVEVFPGQVVGLMGPSGSGKTTLLNCIACILEPSRGGITLDGEVVYDEPLAHGPICAGCGSTRSASSFNTLICCLSSTPATTWLPCSHLAGFGAAAARARGDRTTRLSRGRSPQARDAVAAFWRGGATRRDRPRARQSAAHHPRRRADRAARFPARPHRHGPAASDCRRIKVRRSSSSPMTR